MNINKYSVPLSKIINAQHLEVMYSPKKTEDILIRSKDVSRPGLELTGFFDYYDNKRILLIGSAEYAFLKSFSLKQRHKAVNDLMSKKPPAMILSRNLEPFEQILNAAKKYSVPLLRSCETTSSLMASLVSYMNVELAPRITRHGVLMEIYGEGVLIIGDSGVGKSETAIELIKRGHRLIADDSVEIRRVSDKSLVGTSPENIRHFIELRGIGIINAMKIFGISSVKLTEKIDMIMNLEIWDDNKVYDRMGMENEVIDLMGIKVPIITIPVKPGRNLAIIIEVAAMNNRQRKMGYNSAKALLDGMGMGYDQSDKPIEKDHMF